MFSFIVMKKKLLDLNTKSLNTSYFEMDGQSDID